MEKVVSADGTVIAVDRFGQGPAVVVVGGALCTRHSLNPLARALAATGFTVFSYDRRGRGDSQDGTTYAVAREIEDIAAVIALAGGGAAVYGHSSGASLALNAAAADLAITRLVLHEPPYAEIPEAEQAEALAETRAELDQIEALLAAGRRTDAVETFLRGTGMPPEVATEMATSSGMADVAPTLIYDLTVVGSRTTGGAIPYDLVERLTMPVLVLCGGASAPFMIDTAHRIANALPTSHLIEIPDHGHAVPEHTLVPILAEFLA